MEQLIPPPAAPQMTEDEYLRMEEAAQTKHEFRNGQIIDMAGGTFDHSVIAANLMRELGKRLEGKNCQPLGSDMRVRISQKGHYCYPDAMIVCGEPVFHPPEKKLNLINPQVVIEVTSPSSEKDDLMDKFDDYRRVESLQEYIVVSQQKPDVRTFVRQSGGIWAFGPAYNNLDQVVLFPSLNIAIPMREFYARITFPAQEVPTPRA